MSATSAYLNRRLRSEREYERCLSHAVLDRAHMAQTVLAGGVNAVIASLREIEAAGYESYADALWSLRAGAVDALGELQGLKLKAAFDAGVDCPPEPEIASTGREAA